MINEEFKSISDIIKAFPDENSCITHLEELRWNGIVISPFDSISKVYSCSNNRFRCKNSRKYFNAKTGTLFHNSKIELQKWFIAIWLITHEGRKISSIELSQILNTTQKTAWFMIRRIKSYYSNNESLENEKNTAFIEKRSKLNKDFEMTEVKVTKDKHQLLEWLQLIKK
jgi:transposase-like protein